MSLIPFDTRNYDFQSIYNFRDFGGYKGLDGRAVKTGRLFRSAHLAALTPDDLSAIENLNINLVVDLRHAPERTRQPSRLPSTAPELYELPDHPERQGAKFAPHEAFMETELYTAQDAHSYMMKSYKARPHDPSFQTIFADTLRFMAKAEDDKGAGVLVHCAAGKDRTGTLCALIKGALGVSREDILADYMLTLDAVDIDQIIGPAAKMISQRYGRTIDAETLWPMFGVAPEFLESALDGMMDSAGDVKSYICDDLGMSESDLNQIQNRYLT